MENKRRYPEPKEVRLVDQKIIIPNIYELEKVGAGHDGIVYRYQDLALKLLKYDVNERKVKNLMTFTKANYFSEQLQLKRITTPIDTMLDADGIYTGYVMVYLEDLAKPQNKKLGLYKNPGDYTCEDLVFAGAELEEDFAELTNARVTPDDINRGSYIFTDDFLYLCDTDKYRILSSNSLGARDLNSSKLNFTIAKFLFYEMQKSPEYKKEYEKNLLTWVRKSCGSRSFLKELNQEISWDLQAPIHEYADYMVKKLNR